LFILTVAPKDKRAQRAKGNEQNKSSRRSFVLFVIDVVVVLAVKINCFFVFVVIFTKKRILFEGISLYTERPQG
jgi:hypothetical protein